MVPVQGLECTPRELNEMARRQQIHHQEQIEIAHLGAYLTAGLNRRKKLGEYRPLFQEEDKPDPRKAANDYQDLMREFHEAK